MTRMKLTGPILASYDGRMVPMRVSGDGARSLWCLTHKRWFGGHCPSCLASLRAQARWDDYYERGVE